MKYSLRWLQDYVTLSVPPEELMERLTLAGAEVEAWHSTGVQSPHVVVGQIIRSQPHPNADRLRVCQVQDGQGLRQIVCGAKNFQDGDKAPLALPGAELPGGFKIKESKLRGELSQGMLCSAKELALAEDAEGLLILPANAPVGKLFHEYYPGDTQFEIEVTPNRPDWLSYIGLAREIVAIGAGEAVARPPFTPDFRQTPSNWRVVLNAGESCPYYTAVLLSNIKVSPSPQWLQDKLIAQGLRPINNVVDITNYVLLETGQPLHAFDADHLQGSLVQTRAARAGETILALDGKTYTLQPQDLVIADSENAVALAGVMGGKPSAVTESTTTVLLESAWFQPALVRATSRRLGLISDSSYRFERRVDPAGVLRARDRAIQLLQELAGATLAEKPLVVGTSPASHGPIELRATRVTQVLGYEVPTATIEAQLENLGCIQKGDGVWQPPSFRYDLATEIDLIEEIARLGGLQNVLGYVHLGLADFSDADRNYDKIQKLRRTLATLGWNEALTDALVERAQVTEQPAVELSNPLNEQYTHLRPNLQIGLLASAGRNLARGLDRIRLFEIGLTYQPADPTPAESMHLGLVLAGPAAPLHWAQAERATDPFDLKSITDYLQKKFGLIAPARSTLTAGQLKAHGIKVPLYYLEYDLNAWLDQKEVTPSFQELPSFPTVRRDLAIVVGTDVPHESVLETIRGNQIPELVSTDLFDIFVDTKGEKIAADKKSLAYALTYRSQDRTLTEKEVNAWQDRLRASLQQTFNCSFRDQ
jgi:phenylalanyl-tRNA synthetase beta chain